MMDHVDYQTEIETVKEVIMSKKNEVFASKREANRALWSNDSPFKAKVIPDKRKIYKRKDRYNKKGLDGPFALSA